jgi:hypothetical protein
MVLAALSLTALLLFAGLALDFGRAHLLQAQLQTALDAAALAGALEVVPMVELSLDRWVSVTETCYDPQTRKPYSCMHWESTSPVVLSGRAWDLLHLGGWRSAAAPRCNWPYRCAGEPRTVREWLVLPPTTTAVSEDAFQKNARWPAGDFGPHIDNLNISYVQNTAEVTATATMTVPTSFLKLAGIRELHIARTGSAVPVKR